MNKANSTLIAAGIASVIALMLSGGAYAQGNNTLATPTTKSPADTKSGYGTPSDTNSESGSGSPTPSQRNSTNTGTALPSFGGNNTLATPSTKSPAAHD
ncbi:hypothetical protein [Paraburkholderia kururiensis]|uniref:Uncharacterized protein n=1 Tax=Paraburkholderia kururiensis TaxID=984307 RepID=A0ABZ0WI77_9BURK|nr:hypothetical protein [Paraburkholderia kururiensis]WQD77067.1 hypothetical protein U0042_23815 [Paraburkholderia kururiensis]